MEAKLNSETNKLSDDPGRAITRIGDKTAV